MTNFSGHQSTFSSGYATAVSMSVYFTAFPQLLLTALSTLKQTNTHPPRSPFHLLFLHLLRLNKWSERSNKNLLVKKMNNSSIATSLSIWLFYRYLVLRQKWQQHGTLMLKFVESYCCFDYLFCFSALSRFIINYSICFF